MKLRVLLPVLGLLFVWSLGGCSGGSSSGNIPAGNCDGSTKLCLISCSLGCDLGGRCEITNIAQNQPIVLNFNDLVDPATVTQSTFSLRTANGEGPEGQVFVVDNTIVFQPQARLVGGQTRFGFRAGETYTLTLPGAGTGAAIRSTSGQELGQTILCTLKITEGLIDLDGQPPVSELILPEELYDVPADATIVVRFSELIDITAFQGGSTQTSPIIYQIRRTRPSQADPNIPECDPNFSPVLVEGVPVASVNVSATGQVTTDVSLKPAVALPNQVCVEVIVTTQVRDLAGTPAQRATYRFFTEVGNSGPQSITETFANDSFLDRLVSGGTWTAGRATPAELGGRGIHGPFTPSLGTQIAPDVYVFNTTSVEIPDFVSLFGDTLTVTDGQFEFTDFVVPAGTRVIFRGPIAPRIRVRGRVDIRGEVAVDGGSPAIGFNPRSVFDPVAGGYVGVDGQAGASAGAGGGRGGQGGDGCPGVGASPDFSGRPGDSIQVPAGSAYAGVPNLMTTGGRGGPLWPTDGLRTSVIYRLFNSICAQMAGGGGGGAFLGAATNGRAIQAPTLIAADLGPDGVAGTSVAFVDVPMGVGTFEHFLVGGAGGGGGGSQPVNLSTQQVNVDLQAFNAGGGGAGGAGALGLRVGGEFRIAAGGVLSARGGSGVTETDRTAGPPSPGGGGSGGSLVVQVDQASLVQQDGTINVTGGNGGRIQFVQFNGQSGIAVGGDGGHGFVRLEAKGSIDTGDLGTVEPAAAVLTESAAVRRDSEIDAASGFASLWRATRQVFPPTFLYYRLTTVDGMGNETIYTDRQDGVDPFNPADQDGRPVRVWFQGGVVNAASNQLEGAPGPWRDYVNPGAGPSISSDGATGFRFMVVFDLGVASDTQVTDLQVWFRP